MIHNLFQLFIMFPLLIATGFVVLIQPVLGIVLMVVVIVASQLIHSTVQKNKLIAAQISKLERDGK